MTIDTKNMLSSILESISRIDYIKPTQIPNIDLYMDQVTTFMEEGLEQTKRYPDDKILTKIETLLDPITSRYFGNESSFSMTDIYEEVCALEKSRIDSMAKDIARLYKTSLDTFTDAPEEDREMFQNFSFICSLAFDVYVKKQVIEKLIDDMPEPEPKKKK